MSQKTCLNPLVEEMPMAKGSSPQKDFEEKVFLHPIRMKKKQGDILEAETFQGFFVS